MGASCFWRNSALSIKNAQRHLRIILFARSDKLRCVPSVTKLKVKRAETVPTVFGSLTLIHFTNCNYLDPKKNQQNWRPGEPLQRLGFWVNFVHCELNASKQEENLI